MRFSVLGTFEVWHDDVAVELSRPKERRLLALLISRVGSAVPMGEIVEQLWRDAPPPSAARTVQSHFARIRKVVPGIETSVAGYLLRADPGSVDAQAFEELARRGAGALRTGDAGAAAASLAEALRLWRGPAYAEFAADGDGFAAVEAARLAQLRLACLEDRWDAGLRVGEHREAAVDLERLVAEEPLRERLWGLLMLALYRCDRQADALAAYRRARRVLVDELGVDPGPSLQRLHAAVLAQDSGLRDASDADPSMVLARELRILAGDSPPAPGEADCPWRGLRSYEIADRELFVGRERVTAELVARLASPGVVTVLGASGVGKSSLIRAGVVAALPQWRPVVFTPGAEPDRALARAAEAVARADGEPVLVVIDQAEEMLSAASVPVDRLLSIMDCPGVRLVLVVRADMAGQLVAHPELADRLRDTVYMLGAMTPAELTRVVVSPAARAGRHVEPALLGRILADLQGHDAVLPLLATALEATWQAVDGPVLTLEAYLACGGIAASLERRAEDALNSLDEAGRSAARRILLRLADSELGQPVVRRRAPLIEIAPPGDPAAAEAYALLLEQRLVTASSAGVEVTHEALFGGWPRLRGWLDEDAHGRHLLRDLAPAAATWSRLREDSTLYRGSRLRILLDWASPRRGELTAVERDFLDESQRVEQREAFAARRRTRRLASAVVALLVALVVASGSGIVALARTAQARSAATTAQAQRLGALALTHDRLDTAMLLAVGGVRTRDSLETRGDLLATLLRAPDLLRVARRPGRVLGMQAAVRGGPLAVGERDGDLVFLDAATLTPSGAPVHLGDAVFGVSVRPDGARVAAVVRRDDAMWLVLVDVASRREIASVPGDYLGLLAYSPDGRWLAATIAPGGATVLPADATNGVPLFSVGGRSDWTIPVFAGADRLLLAESSGAVGIWDIASARRLGGMRTGPISAAAASPDGASLVVGGPDGELALWTVKPSDVDSPPAARIAAHHAAVQSVAFSADGVRIATGGDDGAVHIWDGHHAPVAEEPGHGGRVTAVSWSGDRRTLYSAGLDGAVMSWDAAADRSLARRVGPSAAGAYTAVGFAASRAAGRAIVAVDGGGTVLYAPDHPGSAAVLGNRADTGAVLQPAFSADGRLAYTADEVRGVFVWDVVAGRLLRNLPMPGAVSAIAADPGGIAVALHGGRVIVVDPQTGRVTGPSIDTGAAWPAAVARSPDGHTVAVAVDDGVALYDAGTGARRRLLGTPGVSALAVAYRSDGARIVAGGADGVLRLWDPSDGRALAAVAASAGTVLAVAYAPDGRLVASGGTDGTVRLFDAAALRPIGRPLPGVTNRWAFPAFLDDATLLAGFADGTVLSYEVSTEAWIRRACRVAGRQLSAQEKGALLTDRTSGDWCGVSG